MSGVSRTYNVSGMSCEHCVRAVTEAVSGVAGVVSVEVDLSSGTVTVVGGGDTVTAAISDAGYDVEA